MCRECRTEMGETLRVQNQQLGPGSRWQVTQHGMEKGPDRDCRGLFLGNYVAYRCQRVAHSSHS